MATDSLASYEFIEVDSPADRVRHLKLNRPDKRNAISTCLLYTSPSPRDS